jgi:hypothetical protein
MISIIANKPDRNTFVTIQNHIAMKGAFYLVIALTVFFAACTKDNNNGGSTNTTTYQPITAGSTWQYELDDKLTTMKSEFTLTATSKDSSINGRNYTVFTNSSGGNDYYYNDGSNYYQFGGIAGITGNTELLYLKSSVAAGSQWEETKTADITGLGSASVKLTYTLVEKIPSLTVETKTYTEVLHVKVQLSNLNVGGFPLTIASQDLHFYYAPNIGRIKDQVKLTINPPIGSAINVDNETNLKSYTIK